MKYKKYLFNIFNIFLKPIELLPQFSQYINNKNNNADLKYYLIFDIHFNITLQGYFIKILICNMLKIFFAIFNILSRKQVNINSNTLIQLK